MGKLKDFMKHILVFWLVDKFGKLNDKVEEKTGKKIVAKEGESYLSKADAIGCGCLTLVLGTAAITLAGAYMINKATHYITNFEFPKIHISTKIELNKPIKKAYNTVHKVFSEPYTDISQVYNSLFSYDNKLEEALKIADKHPGYGNKDGVLGEKKELKGICNDAGLVYVPEAKIPYSTLEKYVKEHKK